MTEPQQSLIEDLICERELTNTEVDDLLLTRVHRGDLRWPEDADRLSVDEASDLIDAIKEFPRVG